MESRLRSWELSVEKTLTLVGGRGTEAGGEWGQEGGVGCWTPLGAVYKSGGGVAFGLAHRKGVGNHDIHAFIHEL